jgi:hypothetical protein
LTFFRVDPEEPRRALADQFFTAIPRESLAALVDVNDQSVGKPGDGHRIRGEPEDRPVEVLLVRLSAGNDPSSRSGGFGDSSFPGLVLSLHGFSRTAGAGG